MKVALFILITFVAIALNGQVTTTAISLEQAEKIISYQGSRIMFVDNASTSKENLIYVFSKPDRGTQPDSLFFEVFEKKGKKWERRLSEEFSKQDKGYFVTWQNRKAFFDYDKDQELEALFIFSKSDADLKNQSIHLILIEANEIAFLQSNLQDDGTLGETEYSSSFYDFDENTQKAVNEYWRNLDKN